jgi:hypothetical protein
MDGIMARNLFLIQQYDWVKTGSTVTTINTTTIKEK